MLHLLNSPLNRFDNTIEGLNTLLNDKHMLTKIHDSDDPLKAAVDIKKRGITYGVVLMNEYRSK